MNIDVRDLYQLLIAECRYGYTRNNHLMPDGAYDHVKKYLPIMLKEDQEFAIHTAKQLCEECISEQLCAHFDDGFDDENGSRHSAFKFIGWLLKFVNNDGDTSEQVVGATSEDYWIPYNFKNFSDNITLDDEPLYNIYEDDYSKVMIELKEMGPEGNPINEEKLSKNVVVDYLFREILKVTDITYRRWNIDKYTTKYVFDDLKRVFYIRREPLK